MRPSTAAAISRGAMHATCNRSARAVVANDVVTAIASDERQCGGAAARATFLAARDMERWKGGETILQGIDKALRVAARFGAGIRACRCAGTDIHRETRVARVGDEPQLRRFGQ